MYRFIVLVPILLLLTACNIVNVRVVDKFVVDFITERDVEIRTDFSDNPRFVNPTYKIRFTYNFGDLDYNVTCPVLETEYSVLKIGDEIPVVTGYPNIDCMWIMKSFNNNLIKNVNQNSGK